MKLKLKENVVLVGLMGAGKTSVGWRLSKELGVAFYDSDELIEKALGMSISDFFEKEGEVKFRQIEYETIKDNLVYPPHLLATGGGAFIQEDTRDLIQERAVTLWLNADLDVLIERVSRKNTRPLLEQGDKAKIMHDLFEQRSPIYEQADIEVASGDDQHHRVVERIMDKLIEYGCAEYES